MIRFLSAGACLFVSVLLLSCGSSGEHSDESEASHDEHAGEAAEVPKGAHGGRLLEDGDLKLEVSIFEDGVPPEFRLYATEHGKPLSPEQLQAAIELRRISGTEGGIVDRHSFVPREDYLVSAAEVYEPHSFDVSVSLQHAGKSHQWKYESPEARVEMDPAVTAAAGLVTVETGPGTIADQLLLYGRIVPDAERVRQVRARFPGPVKSVGVRVGDTVRAGQVLATIESNESLQTYPVTAPIAGLVTVRNVNVGEGAGSDALFEIADYGSVWAELAVFPRDRARLAVGKPVDVRAAEGALRGIGTVRFISPVGAASSSVNARVVLDNRDGQWTPGQFIEGQVSVAESAVPLIVPLTALQRVRDWDVVFVNEGSSYQALPIQLGRRDSANVEVVGGLLSGARVVAQNSYLVKADIEKSGASHDH